MPTSPRGDPLLHVRLARPTALYGVLAALHAAGRVPRSLAFDGVTMQIEVDGPVADRLRRRIDVLSVEEVLPLQRPPKLPAVHAGVF